MSEVANPQQLDQYGRRGGTVFENREHQTEVLAKRVTKAPSPLQREVDYDARTDAKPVYFGYAARGVATSADSWFIIKYTWDGSSRFLRSRTADGSWDNRASLTYT